MHFDFKKQNYVRPIVGGYVTDRSMIGYEVSEKTTEKQDYPRQRINTNDISLPTHYTPIAQPSFDNQGRSEIDTQRNRTNGIRIMQPVPHDNKPQSHTINTPSVNSSISSRFGYIPQRKQPNATSYHMLRTPGNKNNSGTTHEDIQHVYQNITYNSFYAPKVSYQSQYRESKYIPNTTVDTEEPGNLTNKYRYWANSASMIFILSWVAYCRMMLMINHGLLEPLEQCVINMKNVSMNDPLQYAIDEVSLSRQKCYCASSSDNWLGIGTEECDWLDLAGFELEGRIVLQLRREHLFLHGKEFFKVHSLFIPQIFPDHILAGRLFYA